MAEQEPDAIIRAIEGGLAGTPRRQRTPIHDEGDDRQPVVDSVIEALNREPVIFSFAGQTMIIKREKSIRLREHHSDEGEEPNFIERMKPVRATPVNLLRPVEERIEWHGMVRRGRGAAALLRRRIDNWLLIHLAQMDGDGLHPLMGVADFPVMVSKDKLLTGRLGYHQASGLWIDSQPMDVDPEQFRTAQEAYDFLAGEWLNEFNWRSDRDMFHALSLPLTVLKRKTMIIGGAPAYMVSAPDPKSGKTEFLKAVQSLFGLPHYSSRFSANDEEFRKAFMSAILENPAILPFDNVPRGWRIAGKEIESYATMDAYSDRILKKSLEVTVPSTAVLVFNGNNISAGSVDMASRAVMIMMECPSWTQTFKKEVVSWSSDNAAKILSAYVRISQLSTAGEMDRLKGGRFPAWERQVALPLLEAAKAPQDYYDFWITAHETGGGVDDDLSELMDAMADDLAKVRKNHQSHVEGEKLLGSEDPTVGDEGRALILEKGYQPVQMAERFQDQLMALSRWVSSRSNDGGEVNARAVNALLDKHADRRLGDKRLRRVSWKDSKWKNRSGWTVELVKEDQ